MLGFGKRKPEKEKIPKHIAKLIEDQHVPIETMIFFAEGDDGQLILTNEFALIGREGLLNKLNANRWQKGAKIIPYDRVEEIQFKDPGLTGGYIQFVMRGGPGRKTGLFAVYDDNTVTFTNKKHLEELKWIFEERGMLSSEVSAQPLSSTPNIADEISKLAALKKEGLISEEEYKQLKTKLINK